MLFGVSYPGCEVSATQGRSPLSPLPRTYRPGLAGAAALRENPVAQRPRVRAEQTRLQGSGSSITARCWEGEEGREERRWRGESRHGGDGRQEQAMPALARMRKICHAESWWQKCPHVRVHMCHQHVKRGKPAKAGARGPAAGHIPVPPSQEAARYWWK